MDRKTRDNCLRWFGHVQKIAINASIRKSELIQVKRAIKVEDY